MSEYYNRKGEPITAEEWAASFSDKSSKRVAETDLPNGIWISTVWLGLNHQFDDGPPLIFETMAFKHSKDGPDPENDMDRYSTEEEALEGHKRMVEKWAAVGGAAKQ